ncbi:TetR/AcrR family transcriptional regulator [Nocardia neocaledoniensis]|uniref:TetR/AcrR family transcriptional regulator n=1 Tax=Nocardia neocaledoniensis TaxID=236511 RepID=UPI00245437EB|nr:helix-turn-helix domain-containing protein [Nocardia neocaledoniensis]
MVDAGEKLFAAQGYEATTQRQIAAAAGVSTSVLFRHFNSKAQLLAEAVIEPFGEFAAVLAEDFQAAVAAGRQPAPWFAAALVVRLRVHRASLRALLSTLQSADGDALMAALGGRLDVRFDEIRRYAERAPAAENGDLVLRLLVATTTTMVALEDWFLPPGHDPARLAEVLGNMASRGETGSSARATRHARRPTEPVPMGEPTKPSGRRRNPDEVREALLLGAAQSFAQRGFAATTYLDIAGAAHTSESALFRHFGSKSNLLIEAVLEPFADAFRSVSRRWAAVAPEHRRARQMEFVADLYSTLVANRQLLRILMGVANDPAHEDVNAAVAAWFSSTFAELVSQQETLDGVDPGDEPELRIRAALAMLMAAAVLDDWFLPREDVAEPSRTIATMSDLITRSRRAASHAEES